MTGVRSGNEVSSDHCTSRCSRRFSWKTLENSRVLTRLARCKSHGKGRGAPVGNGKTRDAEEISRRVISAGLTAGSINIGHSSNVFRISIS